MNTKVTKQEVIDAITYLWGTGATLQMRSDDQQYTEILIKFAANRTGIELG
jgi:hypothetical protein